MIFYLKKFQFLPFLNGFVEIYRIRTEQKEILLTQKSFSPFPKVIQAHEKRLRQILMNLLSKAVNFAKKGGITFKVGDQEANSSFKWKIDTGVAIAPEQLEAIFYRFNRWVRSVERHKERD